MYSIKHLKKGDKFMRCLKGDKEWMMMTVVSVQEKTVKAAAAGTITMHWPESALWTFDRETGAEEDEDLGWGAAYGISGSYAKPYGA